MKISIEKLFDSADADSLNGLCGSIREERVSAGVKKRIASKVSGGDVRRISWTRVLARAAAAVIALSFVLTGLIWGIPVLKENEETGVRELVLAKSLLTVKVSADEKTDEGSMIVMTPGDGVKVIKTYNPLMSNYSGLGTIFEFEYPGASIELKAGGGSFVEVRQGKVEYIGRETSVEGGGTVIWNPSEDVNNLKPDPSFDETIIEIRIKEDGHLVGLGAIHVRKQRNWLVSSTAELLKAVDFPKVDGEYQEIGEEFVENFFSIETNTSYLNELYGKFKEWLDGIGTDKEMNAEIGRILTANELSYDPDKGTGSIVADNPEVYAALAGLGEEAIPKMIRYLWGEYKRSWNNEKDVMLSESILKIISGKYDCSRDYSTLEKEIGFITGHADVLQNRAVIYYLYITSN